MKALVVHEPGGAFVMEERPDPVAGTGEAVARNIACGMGLTIEHTRMGRNRDISFPVIIGHEITADIVAVGSGVAPEVLQVGESSLYPALQRLLLNGWVSAEWGASENNRRARYYTITADGRKRLLSERKEFQRIVGAIQQVLETA